MGAMIELFFRYQFCRDWDTRIRKIGYSISFAIRGVYVLMVFAVVKSVYDSICWFEVMSDCIVQFANTIKIFSLLGFDDYLCCKIVIYTILFLPVLYSTLISVPFLNCTYFFCFVKYLT